MADTLAAIASGSRPEPIIEPDSRRLCLACREEIEDWRGKSARLCHDCAAGRKKRVCACGKTFRSRNVLTCPDCRLEKQRQSAKTRWAQIRAKRETLGRAELPKTPLTEHVETGVNLGKVEGAAPITHETVLALRLRLSMSQSEFGRALGALRGHPYGRSYMSKAESGKAAITAALQRAIHALSDPTQHLRVLPSRVYAVETLPPGTIVLGRPVVCPVCRHIYVMPWPTQRHCSPECKRIARREQARKRRLARKTVKTGEPK